MASLLTAPTMQWWTIAPYDYANAAQGTAANSTVMAGLDPAIQ
ncbi:MAG: hypothetical protein ACLPX9_17905 [Rhodomicrobium sp.]